MRRRRIVIAVMVLVGLAGALAVSARDDPPTGSQSGLAPGSASTPGR